jgi:putative heme-binding domain-containing protein
LTLAEVQVFSDGANIASRGSAKQSTTAHGADANRAIDGKTNGGFAAGSQTHTREDANDPWWELDLKAEYSIESVVVWNRTEEGLGQRLKNFTISILDSNRREVYRKDRVPAPQESVRFDLAGDLAGSIRRSAINALVTTGRDETQTFELLAKLIREGQDRATAVRAITRLPQNRWPQQQLQPLVNSIVGYVRELPASERTAPAVQDALQLGNDLAAMLPTRVGQPLRSALRELGVPVLLIRPIAHQILFDKAHLYVEAGRPVEVVFENLDIMPHNFVVTKPGQLERVGIEGEKMAADPNAFSKNFVPDIPQVLAATRLLQPQQTDRINFTAPTELGDYPFVCTFPGHWRRMNGILHVVKNLDDVPRDALLAAATQTQAATRPFVRNWTVADLSQNLDKIASGNVNAGRELFKTLACVQCHRMKGVGGQVGPDLVSVKEKMDSKKMKLLDVLTEMVEPSKVIEDKFRSIVLELADGRVVSGIIVAENAKEVRLAANPLDPQASAEPITIAAGDIEARFPSAISLMPQGLLNTLNEEEISNLLSYILSGG